MSEREREVLALLADGWNDKSIAGRLFISPYTVQNIVAGIYRKLDVARNQGLSPRVVAALWWREHRPRKAGGNT